MSRLSSHDDARAAIWPMRIAGSHIQSAKAGKPEAAAGAATGSRCARGRTARPAGSACPWSAADHRAWRAGSAVQRGGTGHPSGPGRRRSLQPARDQRASTWRSPSTKPPATPPEGPGSARQTSPATLLKRALSQLPSRLLEPVGRFLGEPALALGGRLRAAAGDLARGIASTASRFGAGLGTTAHGVAAGPEGLYGLHAAALPLIRCLRMLSVGHVRLSPKKSPWKTEAQQCSGERISRTL